jgi:signal peptidase I
MVFAPSAKPGAKRPLPSIAAEALDIGRTVGAALLIALVLRVAVFQPYNIPSSSMEPGLQTGDYFVVSKFAYGWSRASLPFDPPLFAGRLFGRAPERGDVVVFRLPRDPSEAYIKRLIGLPGDRVRVREGVVYVNDRAIPRQAVGAARDHDDPTRLVPEVIETTPGGKRYATFAGAPDGAPDNTGVYVVPTGQYFLMGDNRDNSLDSRWPRELGVGFVPAENLIGRAEMVLLSWRAGVSVWKPWTWITHLQPGRAFKRIL